MPHYRILIVEDQREVGRLLRSALLTLEHELVVIELPSAEEAILDSTRNKVDLLVSDYRLPGMTGVDLLHKVRKNHPETKVILITGQTDPRIRKDVAESGADAFFIKPVPIADFLDAVERHLGLVDTILPPEPIEVDDEVVPQPSLPDLLAGLRQDLSANTVILLNDTGRILARAGDFPNSKDELSITSSLLTLHSTGKKVAAMIGQQVVSNWHVFNGGQYDLISAPVGTNHVMAIIGKSLAGEGQAVKTMELFILARKDIEQFIGESVTEISSVPEEHAIPAEAIEQGEREMEPLFKDAKKKLKPAEVKEFWDNAADNQKALSNPDMLSYEQARKLGLAPKDKS